MRIFSLIIGFVLLSGAILPAMALVNDSLTLDDLDNSAAISYSLQALGGHSGYCLTLSLKNNSGDTIGIYIEPGRVLVCDSSFMQDLIVMRALYFKVSPREESQNSLFAFCCRAKKMSPSKNTRFEKGYLDRDGLGMLAAFVSQGNYLPADIQSSVWVISDMHPIASICSQEMDSSHAIKKWLAEKLKRPLPWYCIQYDMQDTSVFQNKHLRVSGNIKFRVSHYSLVTVQIRSKNGLLIKTLQNDVSCAAGEFTYPLDLDVKGWPSGNYEILIFEDGNRRQTNQSFIL
jgi:hypothetical protein